VAPTGHKGLYCKQDEPRLAGGTTLPEFETPEAIIRFARELGRLALTADVDMRRLAVKSHEVVRTGGLSIRALTARFGPS
jgi:hypothetical protein